jgi:hypothetical protein
MSSLLFRRQAFASLLALSPLFLLMFPGCGGSTTDPAPICPGVTTSDGRCLKKCDISKCSEGQQCVVTSDQPQGLCQTTCTDICTSGQCEGSGTALDSSTPLKFCVGSSTPTGTCQSVTDCDQSAGFRCIENKCQKPGLGTACTTNEECDAAQGHQCVNNKCAAIKKAGEACTQSAECEAGAQCVESTCRNVCNALETCPEGTQCKGKVGLENGALGVCLPSTVEIATGKYGTDCTKGFGKCETGYSCVGATDGDDSIFWGTPYCTQTNGCSTTADCPEGYWCGEVRGSMANPKACLRSDFCSPCETDVDCSGQTGALCVPDINGEKFCSLPCNPNTNSCIQGASCEDVGNGVMACRPDAGSCHVDAGPGCSACRVDSDCQGNGICRNGDVGYGPGMKWCMVPCGSPDADGKRTCPVAPNGAEMYCLDENQYALGGPFDSSINVYGFCYAPLVNDASSPKSNPVHGTCYDAIRTGDEECDDGNNTSTDGCDQCKVSDTCKFTVTEPNGDGNATLKDSQGNDVTVIPALCKTALISGGLESDSDVDNVVFGLKDGFSAWVEVFGDSPATCPADIMMEVRSGTVDLTKTCADLNSTIFNLSSSQLCPDGKLGCGSCTVDGLCGTCDDDNGVGNCPKTLVSTTTSYAGYVVKFASQQKTIRVYAKKNQSVVQKYNILISTLTGSISEGPKFPPALTCF